MTAAAIFVLTVGASLFIWYWTLALTASHQDNPWFAVLVAMIIAAGGIMLSISTI